MQLDCSQRGKPSHNVACEAFNGSVRREYLSQTYFLRYVDARQILENWKDECDNPTSRLTGAARRRDVAQR